MGARIPGSDGFTRDRSGKTSTRISFKLSPTRQKDNETEKVHCKL